MSLFLPLHLTTPQDASKKRGSPGPPAPEKSDSGGGQGICMSVIPTRAAATGPGGAAVLFEEVGLDAGSPPPNVLPLCGDMPEMG